MSSFIPIMLGVLLVMITCVFWELHCWKRPWMGTRPDDTFFRT